MGLEEIKDLYLEANDLRKRELYNEALQMLTKIENKDENTISAMANCYRKLGTADKAVKLLNRYIKENQNFNITESKWFKTELVWSYRDFYLNENYKNKELSIKAANKILEYAEKNNKYLLRSIKKALFNKEVITNYTDELKNILDKIDFSNRELLEDINELKLNNKSISNSIYYNIILTKMKVLIQLNQYEEVINLYDRFKNSINDLHIERNMAKAVFLMGEYEKSISILNKASVRFGKQFYIFSDIADIYSSINDIENALKNYYKACILVKDYKFLISIFLNISKLLVDYDKVVAKKHLDLCVFIRQQEKWNLKEEEISLLRVLDNYGKNEDITILKKELRNIWVEYVNKDVKIFEGKIVKVLENGNGFIEYEGKNIFFKKIKNNVLKIGDRVNFAIEENYDKKKNTYSEIATNIKCY